MVNAYKEFIDLYLYHSQQAIVVTLVWTFGKLVLYPFQSVNADVYAVSEHDVKLIRRIGGFNILVDL